MRVGRHPIVSSLPESFNQDRVKVGTGLTTSIDMSGRRRVLTLPKSTGDNKLTEKMVPGYTGMLQKWVKCSTKGENINIFKELSQNLNRTKNCMIVL